MRFAAFWDIASLVIGLATAIVFAWRAWRHGHVDLRATRHVAAPFLVAVPTTWLLVTRYQAEQSLGVDVEEKCLRALEVSFGLWTRRTFLPPSGYWDAVSEWRTIRSRQSLAN